MCVYRWPFNFDKNDWTDHVEKLELTLNKLKERGLKYNTEKYFFGTIDSTVDRKSQ